MPFEMGNGDQCVGIDDFRTNIHGFEMLLMDVDAGLAPAPQSVGNDDGSVDHRIGKSVFNSRFNMIGRVSPRSGIQGVGVRQEWHGPVFLNHFDDFPDVDGAHKGAVAHLTEMNLHGGQVFLGQHPGKAGLAQHFFQFGKKRLLHGCP